MTLVPPGEHLDGTTAECAHLHLLLACFRASPPPMRLPEVTGHPLPEVLGSGIIDPEVFHTGYAIMAARYPERVKQLVVWGGNSYLSAEDLHIFQSMRSLTTWSQRAIEPLRSVYGDQLEALWERYIVGLEDLYAAGGDLYQSNLHKITCPTFILHGDLDPMVPAMHPEIIHRGIDSSELYRFMEGKHNIHKRYAAEFNQVVSSFLNRTKIK